MTYNLIENHTQYEKIHTLIFIILSHCFNFSLYTIYHQISKKYSIVEIKIFNVSI